jgi:uncharacterized membrane protein
MDFLLLIIAIFIIISLYKRIGFLDKALQTISREVEKLKIEVVQLQNQSRLPVNSIYQAVDMEQKVNNQTVLQTAKSEIPASYSQPQQSTKPVIENTEKDSKPIIKNENQFNLIEWIKQDFLVKVGGFFMVIALAWFVSFAFANDWIGPEGRVSMGVLFGSLLMFVGYWQLPKNPAPARVITLVGTTTILTTLYTAQAILGLLLLQY